MSNVLCVIKRRKSEKKMIYVSTYAMIMINDYYWAANGKRQCSSFFVISRGRGSMVMNLFFSIILIINCIRLYTKYYSTYICFIENIKTDSLFVKILRGNEKL